MLLFFGYLFGSVANLIIIWVWWTFLDMWYTGVPGRRCSESRIGVAVALIYSMPRNTTLAWPPRVCWCYFVNMALETIFTMLFLLEQCLGYGKSSFDKLALTLRYHLVSRSHRLSFANTFLIRYAWNSSSYWNVTKISPAVLMVPNFPTSC